MYPTTQTRNQDFSPSPLAIIWSPRQNLPILFHDISSTHSSPPAHTPQLPKYQLSWSLLGWCIGLLTNFLSVKLIPYQALYDLVPVFLSIIISHQILCKMTLGLTSLWATGPYAALPKCSPSLDQHYAIVRAQFKSDTPLKIFPNFPFAPNKMTFHYTLPSYAYF